MNDIYLHIGFDKTGSTSIQKSLWRNRSRLRQSGILYPESGIESSHHVQLARAVGLSWESGGDKSVFGLLKREIGDWQGDIIISSEHFTHRVKSDSVCRLLDNFSGYKINIIVYLRNQFDWLISLYKESIKWGNEKTLSDWVVGRNFDFSQVISIWEKNVGENNINVRSYDSCINIVSDFYSVVGVDVESDLERSNESFPDVVMEFWRLANASPEKKFGFRDAIELQKKFNHLDWKKIRCWSVPESFISQIDLLEEKNIYLSKKYRKNLFPKSIKEAMSDFLEKDFVSINDI
ncbi:hypothetical protein [Chelativorans intermedius]|uniref:Sulfotransferase domain-containing protein n=1 Tax=Chelativorans intermedius TaxID=515947 RepID=A0ABV6D645_9HYPH|nr:hypothetical protein [Chelativorans intermedius]MCT8997418.1 hypothetical protein [Chelativorans intermedius]